MHLLRSKLHWTQQDGFWVQGSDYPQILGCWAFDLGTPWHSLLAPGCPRMHCRSMWETFPPFILEHTREEVTGSVVASESTRVCPAAGAVCSAKIGNAIFCTWKLFLKKPPLKQILLFLGAGLVMNPPQMPRAHSICQPLRGCKSLFILHAILLERNFYELDLFQEFSLSRQESSGSKLHYIGTGS